MLLTHLMLYWGAIYNFIKAFERQTSSDKTRYIYLFVALIPQLLIFHPFILKDIGFAHSYFLVISQLTYYTLQGKKPSYMALFGTFAVLFYGTAVKFQAVFVLPVVSFWIGSLFHKDIKKVIVFGGLIFTVFYLVVSVFNRYTSSPTHSWQYVKLYDLAGISLSEKKPIFPTFVKNDSGFSMERLKKAYHHKRVDELTFIPSPVLVKAKTNEELGELWLCWFYAVLEYPVSYLTHRFHIFWEQINCSFIKSSIEIQSQKEHISPKLLFVASFLEKWHLLHLAKLLTTFSFFLPFQIVYFLCGFYNRRIPVGKTIFFMNGAGLLLILSVFFFSMAAEARYIYLTIGCFHFSHPMLYLLWKLRSQKL
jgi:hypothetical protein